jgi:hypothetical protein
MEAAAVIAPSDQHDREPLSSRLLGLVDRRRWWLFGAVTLLYAASFTGRWRVAPDTALYMELGRNLSEGKGFTYHGVHHNWYEPGLPYTIAASFHWFGEGNYVPLTLFMLACGVVSLWLTYHLFRLHAGRPTAVLMTLLLAITETFYRYCFQIVTDPPFLVGILSFLVGYEALARPDEPEGRAGSRRGPWWGWVAIAVGTLVMVAYRPTIITFLGALGVATLYQLVRGPRRTRHVLIMVLTLACVFAFRKADPRRSTPGEAAYREGMLKTLLTEKRSFALHRMFTVFIPEMASEVTPEAVFGIELGTGVDEITSVAVVALGLALVTRRVLWGAWVAATVAQMAFWLPRERYYLPILPLLLYAVWLAALWLQAHWRGAAGRVAFAGVLLLITVPNILQDGNFVWEQHLRGISSTDLRDPGGRALVEMGELISKNVGENDIVIAEAARELTYFSRRKVIAPPKSLRQPPPAAMEQRVREEVLASPNAFAVMPEDWKVPHIATLLDELGLELSSAVGQVEQPPWKGRRKPPLVLHHLVRRTPAAGAATPGLSPDQARDRSPAVPPTTTATSPPSPPGG